MKLYFWKTDCFEKQIVLKFNLFEISNKLTKQILSKGISIRLQLFGVDISLTAKIFLTRLLLFPFVQLNYKHSHACMRILWEYFVRELFFLHMEETEKLLETAKVEKKPNLFLTVLYSHINKMIKVHQMRSINRHDCQAIKICKSLRQILTQIELITFLTFKY